MINELKSLLWNIPSWHTKRKIVVIESDDWGSVRMPSKEVKFGLINKGMMLEKDPYSLKDGLATSEDLAKLFEVLCSVKDLKNNHAKLTANTNVANPDFQRIKNSDYEQYFFEPFTQTLQNIDQNNDVFNLWKEGIGQNIFYPQFHGREHVNVNKWMYDLKNNIGSTRMWFDYGSFGTSNLVDTNQKSHYMTSWDSADEEDISFYKASLSEGLSIFKNIFGYNSESLIATTYCWPLELESSFKENGVEFIQGIKSQKYPLRNGGVFKYKKNNFLGKRNKNGLIYLNRNAFFEPSQDNSIDWIDDCMSRIDIAFKCYKPATISTHRINFISRIDEKNRDVSLKLFKILLSRIIKKWPEVEFLNSVELGHLIKYDNYGE